jgi:two-component system sensor histidine kinase BarA
MNVLEGAGPVFAALVLPLLLIGWRLCRRRCQPSPGPVAARRRLRRAAPVTQTDPPVPGEFDITTGEDPETAGTPQQPEYELQRKIDEATADLQATLAALLEENRELDKARQKALEASQEKTAFLARMSHEIRTPLSAVIGFSRLLDDAPDSLSAKESIRVIKQTAHQLLYVIDDILSFSRLEAGSMRLEAISFELSTCLEDVVAMMSPAAHEKGLELILHLHGDLPGRVVGDAARVSQVMTNLLANAIKFTAVGHVMVEAMLVGDSLHSGRVRITVSDTGEGLTAEEMQNVFQAFTQADSSVTRRFGGTGLGLAICKCLVERMQGTIGVQSEKGTGSRFTLEIPFDDKLPADDPIETSALRGKKVLLHEAHPLSRRTLRATLAGWGIQVFNSSDRHQLLRSLAFTGREQMEFDLLIVGMDPEKVDTASLNRLFRSIRDAYPGPMLFLVGSEIWQPPSRIADCRNIAWAAKPTRRRLLYHRISELLGMASPFRTGRPAAVVRVSQRSFQGHCVLAVEDNEFNRTLLRYLLEEKGAEVVEAASGEEAIGLAKARRYDLIFMDLHMPGIDGAEAARRIRRHYAANSPPVLALSADVFADRQGELPGQSFEEYLIKPISAETLDRVAAAWLGAGRNEAAAPTAGRSSGRAGPGRPLGLPAELQVPLYKETLQLGEAMRSALAESAWGRLSALAHQLHGLAALYGLPELMESARSLESAVEAQGFETIGHCLDRLMLHIDDLPQPSIDNEE